MQAIRSNTIFVRLIIIFLLIVLPIFTVGMWFISLSIGQQDELITSVMQENLVAEMDKLTGQMQALQFSLVNLGGESSLSVLSSRPDDLSSYERATAINALQRRLYELHMGYSHTHMITLYIRSLGIKLHSAFYHVEETTIEFIDDAEILREAAQAQEYNGQTLVGDGFIRFYYQIPQLRAIREDRVPRLLFRVEYDVGSIISSLTNALENMGIQFAMIGRQGEGMITNMEEPAKRAALLSAAMAARESGSLPSGHVQMVRVDRTTYYTLLLETKTPYATTYFFISRDEALAPTMNTRTWIWGLSAMLALAIALYGWYAYTRVQRPVTALLKGFARLESGDMDFQIESSPPGVSVRGSHHKGIPPGIPTTRGANSKISRHKGIPSGIPTTRGANSKILRHKGIPPGIPTTGNEFHALTLRFNSMLLRLKGAISQLYEQRILAQEAEMKHLQAQINPHFLYNNFYMLDSMLHMEDYAVASKLCRLLGDYFRYVTRSDQPYAALADELRHAKTYAGIQQMRFGGQLSVVFPEDDETRGLGNPKVPRMILQPILENAFKHALERQEGRRALRILLTCDEAHIHIAIENDGPVLPRDTVQEISASLRSPSPQGGTGLYNVHRRLKLMYGTGLIIKARPQGGMRVEIVLPKEGVPHGLPSCDL